MRQSCIRCMHALMQCYLENNILGIQAHLAFSIVTINRTGELIGPSGLIDLAS